MPAAAVVETALSAAQDEWEPDGSDLDAADWARQWSRERDRMVRLHLGPSDSGAEPETEAEPEVEEPPVIFHA